MNIRWFSHKHTGSKRFALLVLLVLLVMATPLAAQERRDNAAREDQEVIIQGAPDTVLIESYAKRYDPGKAILYAAILPGLGQIYNKKYWKLPLVYGGFIAIGYGLNWYNDLHKEYRGYLFDGLELGIGENQPIPGLPQRLRGATVSTMRSLEERARRERDFMIILMGGMYILQMIDAHVDTHLKEFDLNPRLQVSIEPTIDSNALIGRTTGVSLVVRF